MTALTQIQCGGCPSKAVLASRITGDPEGREWLQCTTCGWVDSPVSCTVDGCGEPAVAFCDGPGCSHALCGDRRTRKGHRATVGRSRTPLQRCRSCARKRRVSAVRQARHRAKSVDVWWDR